MHMFVVKLNAVCGISHMIYASDTGVEIIKGFCPEYIVQLYREIQNFHPSFHLRQNRIPVLKDYAEKKAKNIGPFICAALEDPLKQLRCMELLNMPAFVGFRILDTMGLPKDGDVVFSSTATANSLNDDAVTTALHIMGFTDEKKNIIFQRSSTAAIDGLTMVSRGVPKNDAVYFKPHVQLDEFPDVARSLAKQFFDMTLKLKHLSVNSSIIETDPNSNFETANNMCVLPAYDHMYHYGCISQNWTTNDLGMPVSNWGIHEQWNILMGTAMMHHVALTLKPGGNAVVKVRVMRRAETLGLTALLSSLFERTEIVDVPDQVCTYVGAVYFNMTHDAEKRKKVADIIWEAMDQSPFNIFCNDVMMNDIKAQATLKLCETHRRSMMDYRSKFHTLFLNCVHHVAHQIVQGKPPSTFPMQEELIAHFDHDKNIGMYFWNKWVQVQQRLVEGPVEEKKSFLSLMMRPWVCGKRNPVWKHETARTT